jgi:hypothetical protein
MGIGLPRASDTFEGGAEVAAAGAGGNKGWVGVLRQELNAPRLTSEYQ